MGRSRSIKSVKAEWSDLVLVCRKCSKKLRGGFGPDGDLTLRKALSRACEPPRAQDSALSRKRRRSSVAVVEVGCRDLCPKNAVVAASSARPGRWFVVSAGMPVAMIAGELGLSRRPAEPPGDSGPDVRSGTGLDAE